MTKNLTPITDIVEWIQKKHIVNEKGKPLEFVQRSFLLDIFRDESPRLVCRKCSQIGFSTTAILKTIRMAQAKGLNCIYTLPTDDDVKIFVDSKVNKIIEKNPVIREHLTSDSVHKKQFGDGFIFYQGTKGQSKGIITSSDLNVHDELDRSDMNVIETYQSRLDASEYKGQWWFSNPSRPNIGVDALWQMSDQKHWHIICPHCNYWQYLDWFENVCFDRQIFICSKCKQELSNEVRMRGQWVPKYPSRDISGYWISQLMAPWKSAAELIRIQQTSSTEFFFNFQLGLPTIGDGLQADKAIILQNCTDIETVPAPKLKLMGVDQGKHLHCVIGNEYGITKAKTLTNWEDLETLFKYEGINLCVIDNLPDTKKATEFANKFPGRVYRCVYDYNDKRKEMFEFDTKLWVVYVHRTRAIDATIESYVRGDTKVFINPLDPSLIGEGKPGVISNCLCDHWSTLYVVGADGQDRNIVKKDRMGNVIRTWESTGPDHYAHANVYYEVARQRWKGFDGVSDYVVPDDPMKPPKTIRTVSDIIDECRLDYMNEREVF